MSSMRTLVFFLLLTSPAWAAEGPSATGWGEVLRMLAGLGIVLGIVFLLYALVRRGFGPIPGARAGILKIVEMRHLGARKAICLVEVRGEELLLGIGADRIELLCRLERGERQSFEDALRSRTDNAG